MLDAFSKEILNRRPNIQFISPRSIDTIPEPSPSIPDLEKSQRIQQLVNGLNNLNTAAEAAEDLIAERAKDVTLLLDLDDPEDFATAQAAARLFPDDAKEIPDLPGIRVVCEITFPMYRQCMGDLKEHGKIAGQRNQVPEASPNPKKTDFGGLEQDRRPQMNNMSVIIPPVPIPAYLIATIPLLFLMLHPLRSQYVNSKIVGHTHTVTTAVAAAVGSGITAPGVPVNPA